MASVAVVGLGLMGSAFATTLANTGNETAAWNRSESRPTPDGVRRVATLIDALKSSELTIVILADYTASTALFTQPDVVAGISGNTVVNLSTGTPEESRAFGELIHSHGGLFLSGSIPAYPVEIGQPDTGLIIAGEESLWEAHQETFKQLGPQSWWSGSDLGSTNALDLALVGGFYHSALGAFLEALAYANSEGVSTADVRRVAHGMADLLHHSIDIAVQQVDAHDYQTDQATVDVHLAAVEMITRSMSRFAVDRTLALTSVEADLRIAQDLGHGLESISVIYEQLRNSERRPRT